MPTEELKNPSQEPSENDWSKEIEIAEGIRKQALEHYKQELIDTWSVQQSIIRNYLWLSLTFIVGYCTLFNKAFDFTLTEVYFPLATLATAFTLALISLLLGIKSMTGASDPAPDSKYVEFFKYLTKTGYDQGNHYALLTKEIESLSRALEEARQETNRRGLIMRRMNKLLRASVLFAVLSVVFFVPTLIF